MSSGEKGIQPRQLCSCQKVQQNRSRSVVCTMGIRCRTNTMWTSLVSLSFLVSTVYGKGIGKDGSFDEEELRMHMWSRGAFDFDDSTEIHQLAFHSLKMSPVSRVRRQTIEDKRNPFCDMTGFCSTELLLRGGQQESGDISSTYDEAVGHKIEILAQKYGQEFMDAINKNKVDHEEDCKKSCELYYCASPDSAPKSLDDLLGTSTVRSYSMGPVPPEDFAESFGFPLDLIKVTETAPLFSATEAKDVIAKAEAEGVHENEFKSGKYQLAGDWLVNLPNTREWFNSRLESTFFPLLAYLFPEIISSQSVIRAHSVSLLKYNATHPRTDVHIDNGILAMTLAMSPSTDFVGGGTYFEHMGVDNILQMEVGHGTFRPGSVRHGGHRVETGTRYILGAFLLLEDRVEHVRRLKNRGSELRREQDLEGAAKHFEWALAMNPKCTTCLKDWAEILHSKKDFGQAEMKIRNALDLLERKDSDAWFTLGVLLSEQGRNDESIDAYRESIAINAEDAELCYNLGIKLGEKGERKEEMQMYALATKADPKFGGAWLNWGTSLAESGNLDDAEVMFLKALGCESDVVPKAMVNLGLLYHTRGNMLAQSGNLDGAMTAALDAAKYLDQAKPLLDVAAATSSNKNANQIGDYLNQYRPLRLQTHRLLGQLYAGAGDFGSAEAEFRRATETFPNEQMAWKMLHRVLDIQGKTEEAKSIAEKIMSWT